MLAARSALRAVETFGRHAARCLEAVQRRAGRLSRGGILTRRLTEYRSLTLDVENIVDDLKRQAELGGSAVDGRHLILGILRP